MKNKIYMIDIKTINKSSYNYWYNLMSEERKNIINKSFKYNDKLLALGAGILLNKEIKNVNTNIIYNEYGKPYLENNRCFFNISHKGDFAVCVFSDKEIGVDIEKVSTFNSLLINKVFNEEEIRYINSDSLLCTKLWTFKESFMKYLGTGTTISPKDIRINLSKELCLNYNEFCNNKIYFKSFIINDYVLTICSEYKEFSNKIEWFN